MKRSFMLIAFFVIVASQGISQTRIITGIVSSAVQGEDPVQGATVLVKGTTIGTTTDMDGKYSLSVPVDADTLIFSFIGMRKAEVPIGSKSELNIALEQDILALEDVVVTALGITKQSRAVTYAAQNVATENLTQARNVFFMQGLSGKVAGLSMTTSGNGATSMTKILLRGNRSIASGNQPIYVVDGVILGAGLERMNIGVIDGISVDDIETLTVLKGANAAALYGSRATNGVIVITTKSGNGAREGVTSSIGFTYQASTPIILEKVQNIYGQGANGIYSKNATVSWGPIMEGQVVDHWSNDPNYIANDLGGDPTYQYLPQPDNIKDFFQTGKNFATNLQVNIKSKISNIAFSYTNTNAEGFCYGDNVKIHNLNMRITSNLTEKLSLDSKINIIRQKNSNFFLTGDDYLNPMRYLYILPRNIRTQDMEHYEFINAAGQLRQHYWKPGDNGSGNPYWQINNCVRPWSFLRAVALFSLKYQIFNDLSIQGRAGWDGEYSNVEGKNKNDTYTVAYNGTYYKAYTSNYEFNSDALLNYHKGFSDFVLDLNAGANYRLSEYDYLQAQGSVFNIENLFALANTTSPVPNEGYEKKVVQSVYGFGELSWRNAMFLNLTGRNDWSSTLPENSRSYFYPSVGLTAVISDLITLPTFFTNLKLRGSYAEVGNDAAAYGLSRLAIPGKGGVISLDPIVPKPNLKPERTRSTELGLGLRMLADRIRLDATLYQTNSYNQLFGNRVTAASGAAFLYQNGADIQNRGLELTLNAVPVNEGSFTWDIAVNWSKNISKVLEIAEGFDVLLLTTDLIRQYELIKGQPFGEIYAKGWVRDDKGNVIINQSNGLPLITPGMSVRCANFNPDWLGGINNTFTYKNLTLSSLIDIRWGGTFVSFTEAVCAGGGILDYTATGREPGSLLFGRDVFTNETGVTSAGETNTVATNAELFWNNVGGRTNPVGEAFIREATNIRLREVILGYNLPKKLISKSPISAARISLVGRNLFFLLNKAEQTDPEIMAGSSYMAEGREAFAFPTTRTYGVSLNVDF